MQLAMGYLTAGDLKCQDKLRASSGTLNLLGDFSRNRRPTCGGRTAFKESI